MSCFRICKLQCSHVWYVKVEKLQNNILRVQLHSCLYGVYRRIVETEEKLLLFCVVYMIYSPMLLVQRFLAVFGVDGMRATRREL
jgi:hypothetical protein